jgi:hypothetical protein
LAKPGSIPLVKQLFRRDHVHPGAHRHRHVLDVLGGVGRRGTEVRQGIGAGGEGRLGVAGRREADRPDADDLAHVAAVLLRGVHDHPDQVEVGMVHQLPDHHLPDEPGPPDDHLVRHDSPLGSSRLAAISAWFLHR